MSCRCEPAAHDDADLVLDFFALIAKVEWDTLLFFFGIIFAVGGLGVLGYLALASEYLYVDLGPTTANVIIGALSAIVDNIPLMFAVLTMNRGHVARPVVADHPHHAASAAACCRSVRRPAWR